MGSKIEEFKQKLRSVEEETSKYKNEAEIATCRIREIADNRAKMEEEFAHMEKREGFLKDQVETINDQLQEKNRKLVVADDELDISERACRSLQQKNDMLDEQIKLIEVRLLSTNEQITLKNEKIQHVEERVKDCQRSLDRKERQIIENESRQKQLTLQLDSSSFEMDRMNRTSSHRTSGETFRDSRVKGLSSEVERQEKAAKTFEDLQMKLTQKFETLNEEYIKEQQHREKLQSEIDAIIHDLGSI